MEVHKDLQMIDIRQKRAGIAREESENALIHASSVLAPQQMDYLYGLVRDRLTALHLNTLHTVNTHWCTMDEIDRLAGGDGYGYTSARVAANPWSASTSTSRSACHPAASSTVVAHKLGHCWQYDNGIYQAEPLKLEGFAEWVASKVLANLAMAGELANMQANMYPQYRDGFAYFQKVERDRGMNAVLDEMRAARR